MFTSIITSVINRGVLMGAFADRKTCYGPALLCFAFRCLFKEICFSHLLTLMFCAYMEKKAILLLCCRHIQSYRSTNMHSESPAIWTCRQSALHVTWCVSSMVSPAVIQAAALLPPCWMMGGDVVRSFRCINVLYIAVNVAWKPTPLLCLRCVNLVIMWP